MYKRFMDKSTVLLSTCKLGTCAWEQYRYKELDTCIFPIKLWENYARGCICSNSKHPGSHSHTTPIPLTYIPHTTPIRIFPIPLPYH